MTESMESLVLQISSSAIDALNNLVQQLRELLFSRQRNQNDNSSTDWFHYGSSDVASWRDGGGRSITQQTHDEERSSSPDPGSGPTAQRDASSDDDDEHINNAANFHVAQSQHAAAAAAAMSRMIRPGMMPGPGPRMAGPPGGPMMFRPILPPFVSICFSLCFFCCLSLSAFGNVAV